MSNYLRIQSVWLATTITRGLLLCFLGLPAFCEVTSVAKSNDLIVAFATQGLDRYADGTTVRDGEKYALVYAKKKSVFDGFKTSGQLVDPTNNVLVYCEGRAKDGQCPQTQVVMNDSEIDPSGTLYVVLLDTRAPDGTVGGDNLVLGYAIAGQTKGFSGGKVGPGDGIVLGNRPDGSTQIDATSLPPSDIPTPVITAIHVADGVAHIQFKNSRADVYYALSQKKNGKDWINSSFNAYRKGGSKPQDIVSFSAPADEASKLFKIVVPDQKYK
jgi:hypothetical protein